MASIKDVAQKAGVGVGTVSRVLNNSGYVSDETREKIEEAMKNLQYTPNELARNLYHKKSGIIAVLVPTVEIPFFAELVHNIEAELYNEGFKIMLCNTDKAHNAELEYLDMLNRHIVDGVITGVHSLDVEEYKKIKKPIVAFDRYLGEDIPVVTVDHKEGGRLAAEILLKNGCKKIVHFRGATAVESPYHERHFEFARIMKEQGVECFDYELAWNKFDLEYYKYAVKVDPVMNASAAPVMEIHPALGVIWDDYDPFYYRKALIKITWDDQDTPSVLAPLGDFFCIGNCYPGNFSSLPFNVSLKPEEAGRYGAPCHSPAISRCHLIKRLKLKL